MRLTEGTSLSGVGVRVAFYLNALLTGECFVCMPNRRKLPSLKYNQALLVGLSPEDSSSAGKPGVALIYGNN